MAPTRTIVTGATSGIGAATVRVLTAAGYDVLATGRRQDRLEALAEETHARILVADVRDVTVMVEAMVKFEPELLVNNAGVGHGIDGLVGLEPHLVQDAFDVNVVSMIQLTAAILPGMIERRQEHIVNIGSVAEIHTTVSALYGATHTNRRNHCPG